MLSDVESSKYFDEGSSSGFKSEEVALEELMVGRHYSVRAPRGWVSVSESGFVGALRPSAEGVNIDLVCADAAHGGRFAPTCVVAEQPVAEGAEGKWFERSTRALLEGLPGFVMLDMGEAVDVREGNALLLGTYILEGESLTCMQCLWIDQVPAPSGEAGRGVAMTLTCATKDFPLCGEAFVRMLGACERLAEESA